MALTEFRYEMPAWKKIFLHLNFCNVSVSLDFTKTEIKNKQYERKTFISQALIWCS